ncbi:MULTISPECIES: TrmB family transcriptional regulator [Halorussus]|uniref:TrmB family transcriptional regulator n=1 Tax=Halorussus TaxID=1070314 RepID=UPI000E20CC03|nr:MULTISPECIES: helix-turn-helix domain-containing protein [Halorussus]NHN57542.1 TrmB family transcriptional regulator [Halorussus sp. JP-T4]
MSAHDAVEALKELGLSNYEARVFVALQRLGTGTAQSVSRESDVPRSQVYGAADDLANRGLVEVVESSPKEYRPVSLSAAREQLRARIEREHERAFRNLDALRDEHADRGDDRDVATLRGHHAIHERVADLVDGATERVIMVAGRGDLISEQVAAALRERADAGVSVLLVTEDQTVADRFADAPVRVTVASPDRTGEFTGRTLLVDDATVLLSVRTEDGPEPFAETALWTADSRIGDILAEYVHAGMQSGFEAGGESED